MKVLHVGEYVNGGVATYLNEILPFQEKQDGIEVYLLMSEFKSSKDIKINVSNKYFYKYKRNIFYFPYTLIQIYLKIKKIKPDIIHLHSTFAGLFIRLLYIFKDSKSKPIIIYCAHGWSFLSQASIIKKKLYIIVEKILSLKTDLIINISNYEHVQSLKNGIGENKSIMIYNGITSENEFSKSIDLGTDKIKILFVGRFDKQKGLDIILNLFQKFRFRDVKLFIAGDSVLSNEAISIPTNVVQLGWVDQKMLGEYYKASDVVIMPSRWEGFGLVAVEAMKFKKPVIVSDRGALPELVQNDENGYVFNLDNEEELASIIDNLNKDKLSQMGVKGYDLFKKKFTSQTMNSKILFEYKRLLKNNN
ncbi:glycosyltransferase [Exiguobacterium aurantiacum]|uniref:glycosyltransferase n=1 Tax=Exiguobacterium aurantiacum TaxID=33987 RepID=UPI00384F3BD0